MLQHQHHHAPTGLSQGKQCYFTTPLADCRAPIQLPTLRFCSERRYTVTSQRFCLILILDKSLFSFFIIFTVTYMQTLSSTYSNNLFVCIYIYTDILHRRENGETLDQLPTVSRSTCCLVCAHSAGINTRQSVQGTLSVGVHVTPFVAFDASHVAHLKI